MATLHNSVLHAYASCLQSSFQPLLSSGSQSSNPPPCFHTSAIATPNSLAALRTAGHAILAQDSRLAIDLLYPLLAVETLSFVKTLLSNGYRIFVFAGRCLASDHKSTIYIVANWFRIVYN